MLQNMDWRVVLDCPSRLADRLGIKASGFRQGGHFSVSHGDNQKTD
jgi:hypothetical protein